MNPYSKSDPWTSCREGQDLQTATLGMGCFWSPEALFGQLPGVVRTRVGYGGGLAPEPTYRVMGDHSETVELDFDPARITYEEILHLFWDNHNPVNINGYKGRQYQSLVLYHNEMQREAVQQVIKMRLEAGREEPETEIARYTTWYLAEDRHQKYYLHRYPRAVERLSTCYLSHQELVNSTIAARLNGLAKGYTNLERIKLEVADWPMSPEELSRLLDLISGIRW